MRTRVAVLLAVAGLLAVLLAFAVLGARGLFDGCSVFLESEASGPVAWRAESEGETKEGTLAPGGVAEADFCLVAPTEARFVDVSAGDRRPARVPLIWGCDDARVLVTDDALVAGGRACG